MTDIPHIPYSDKIEQAFIGSCLLGATTEAIDLGVTSAHFWTESGQKAWAAISKLHSEGKPVDTVTVMQETGGLGLWLNDAEDKGSTASHISYWFETLQDLATRRAVFLRVHDVLGLCSNPDVKTDQIVAQAESSFFDLCHSGNTYKDVDQKKAKSDFIDQLSEAAKHNGLPNKGVRTGMGAVDSMLRGFKPASFNTLAARPGRGKTSMALQIALQAAKKGLCVRFWSYEMPYSQIAAKAVSWLSGEDVNEFFENGYGNMEKIRDAAKVFFSLPIHINDVTDVSVHDIRSQARRSVKEQGTQLFVIDYLQLIPSGTRQESRVQEVSVVSRELKKTFMETGVPGLVLAQMNRSIEGREGLPRLSDLRESGSIEQDSDVVMFLHDNPDEDNGETTLLVRKNRHGRTGKVSMTWEKPTGRFTPIENKNEEETDDPLF